MIVHVVVVVVESDQQGFEPMIYHPFSLDYCSVHFPKRCILSGYGMCGISRSDILLRLETNGGPAKEYPSGGNSPGFHFEVALYFNFLFFVDQTLKNEKQKKLSCRKCEI